MKHVDTKMR